VRPFGFDLDFSDDRSTNGITGSSYAADASGSIFAVAGTNFVVDVTPILWEAADDDNSTAPDVADDGIPDSDADLTDNGSTPNFGNESVTNSVTITRSLNQPTTGSAGGFTVTNPSIGPVTNNFDATDADSNLIASTTANWAEVGIIDLQATLTDYLGISGFDISGGVKNLGRFTPDHFDISISPPAPEFSDTCAAFTYLGSKFDWAAIPDITIRAMNGAAPPVLTQNYEGDFWKLGTTLSYTYVDATVPVTASPFTPASSSQNMPSIVDCNGTISISLNEDDSDDTNDIYDGFNYTRPAASSPVSPFVPDVTLNVIADELTDLDGICFDTGCQAFSAAGITGANLRHGRLQVFNNFGPESEDITNSPFEAQYYDGTSWITNTDDYCSTSLTFCSALAADRVDPSSIFPDPLSAGQGTLTVTTSGTFGEKLDVCLTAPAWLTETDCSAPDETCGEFTFGIYRGNDRIINWREIVR
jgi:MSHA biogenesis protein MshQ